MPGGERYDVYRMRPTHVALLFSLYFIPAGGALLRAYSVSTDGLGDLRLALVLAALWLLPGAAVLARMLMIGTEVRADGILVRRFWRTRLLRWPAIARIWPDDAAADGPLRELLASTAMVTLHSGRWVRLPHLDRSPSQGQASSPDAIQRLHAVWQRHGTPSRSTLRLPDE